MPAVAAPLYTAPVPSAVIIVADAHLGPAAPSEREAFHRFLRAVPDLASGSGELDRLLEMIHEYFLYDVKIWAASNVDAVLLMDDWGTNHSLLINPEIITHLFSWKLFNFNSLAISS